ncbi:MAG: RbsD/FucU family protein [Oligosphaeraceae bacterium]
MLDNVSKYLTGDLLKILCDMGHDDVLILADGNFPAETVAHRLLRYPGLDTSTVLKGLVDIFPLDFQYTAHPVCVMDLTREDKARGMKPPAAWEDFRTILRPRYGEVELGRVERFEFYERARKAYAVVQTGEERQYGNLLLVKGVVY